METTSASTLGVLLFIAAVILAVVAYGQAGEEWVGKLAVAMTIAGPLLVAGAVLSLGRRD